MLLVRAMSMDTHIEGWCMNGAKEMPKGHTKPTKAKCVALCLLVIVALKLKFMSNMEK